jgi:hypothetical protein
LRSRSAALRWLVRKDARELTASTSWWVMIVLIGPLVGFLFRQAVAAYAEVSAGAGAGCGLACAPLVGIWLPTFGAYEIAAMFLLPFVAIRAATVDRQSGALALELQRPLAPAWRVGARAAVLLAAWTATGLAGAIAAILWAAYGGAVHGPEVAVNAAGHVLNGAFTIALAMAAAAIVDHPSTAAILTLAVTIGTWIVGFAAALYGGWWDRAAELTPGAVLNLFQHGLVPVGAALAIGAAALTCLAVAAVWLRGDRPPRDRWVASAACAAVGILVAALASSVPGSWDASESRYNSFPEPAERALAQIAAPLHIDVHLAPQDARRTAFERGPLAKLRRVVPRLEVAYAARTGTGLYEAADPGYGLIRYSIGDREVTSYVITDDGVLEAVASVAGLAEEAGPDTGFEGQPLVASPDGSAWVFYGGWPAVTAGLAWFRRRGS